MLAGPLGTEEENGTLSEKTTILERAWNVLQTDTTIKKSNRTRTIFKPISLPDSYVQNFNKFSIPETRKKASQKIVFSKILAFVDSVKQTRRANAITAMPIAVTNRKFLSIFGSEREVSRAIDLMIKIGLLAEYDESYQFNAWQPYWNHSKRYAYSYLAEKKFKEWCSTRAILQWRPPTNQTKRTRLTTKMPFSKERVRFNSKLHLLKPSDMSKTEFEQYLLECLHENYPVLSEGERLAKEINSLPFYMENPDFQIQFMPKFTWNTGKTAVRKIGIRATNKLVSAKSKKEVDDDPSLIYREDIRKKYGLTAEYDVKSSVPRIAYSLGHGYWLDSTIDLYKKFYDVFVRLCPSERMEWNEDTRAIFKSFFMNSYFDNPSMTAAHLKRAIAQKIGSKAYKPEDWKELDQVMASYRKSIEIVLGKKKMIDSEIFLHESVLYMKVTRELMKEYEKVWQVYDCWYVSNNNNNNNNNNIERRIVDIFEQYIQEWLQKSYTK